MKSTPKTQWVDQEWKGNPSLGLSASMRMFSSEVHTKPIPVWVFGKPDGSEQFSYCVSAGANSSYSYTGLCVECTTLESAKEFVDAVALKGRLIY